MSKGRISAFSGLDWASWGVGHVIALLVLIVLVLCFPYAMASTENLSDNTAETEGETTIGPTAVTVAIETENYPHWPEVGQGATTNPSDNNPFVVTIQGPTTVDTDTMFMGSDNLNNGLSGDAYDYIGVENVEVAEGVSGGDPSGNQFTLENAAFDPSQIESVADTSGTVQWLDNIPPTGTDANYNCYFFINTRVDQEAGQYHGTLYVKTVEA